jgi:hypothetical protein
VSRIIFNISIIFSGQFLGGVQTPVLIGYDKDAALEKISNHPLLQGVGRGGDGIMHPVILTPSPS